MLWIMLAVLALIAGLSIRRRRRAFAAADDEPWRTLLAEDDDEELDLEAIRQAEEEWELSNDWDAADDDEEDWR